ncbi:cobalt ECF transporter T component CbiQ [Coralliovum pocilloporae]|uniref:cobalt ECF transporter T component CbiQ n=1 Tax=Coralliovum pocilloporae TaxID=3066369 RepID=UPI0033073224
MSQDARRLIGPAGLIGGADPRLRIVTCVAFSFVTVALDSFPALFMALGLSFMALFGSRLPMRRTLKRMITMDSFIIFMLATLPFTMPGTELFTLFGYPASLEGFYRASEIALTANAVVLMMLTLVGTMDAVIFGHALYRLRVPESLIHLLLFTVRYIDVIQQEYQRLRLAMRARAFKARNSLHTYRSFGYLIGMLLVRSLERSERILQAMKCRGFSGKFYLLDSMHLHPRDYSFAALSVMALIGLILMEVGFGRSF